MKTLTFQYVMENFIQRLDNASKSGLNDVEESPVFSFTYKNEQNEDAQLKVCLKIYLKLQFSSEYIAVLGRRSENIP